MKILQFTALFVVFSNVASAPGAEMNWQISGSNTLVQFGGDANDDWRLQVSINLTNWTTLTNFASCSPARPPTRPGVPPVPARTGSISTAP